MEQIKHNRHRWPLWMATALIMLLCPVVTHAYEYVNLSGTGFTTSYLISRCSDKHVKIDGETTTLNVSENLNIKEIFAPNTHVNVVLSNHAKFRIDQEIGVTMSAMNVKSLTVSGEGYIYITGNDVAIGLHGGTLAFNNTTANITSRSGNAVVGKNGSAVSISSSVVSFTAQSLALASWNTGSNGDVFDRFDISGSQSHVTVKGGIGGNSYLNAVNSFIVYNGYLSITDTPNSGTSTVFAKNVNIYGGEIYVNQTKSGGNRTDYTGFCCENFNASNCQIEVNSTWTGIYSYNDITLNYASVKSYGKEGYGFFSNRDITIAGNQIDRRVLAVGGKSGIVASGNINIQNHNTLARGYTQNAILASGGIYITPQNDCLYEAYSPVEPVKTQGLGIIHLVRPTMVSGTLAGQSGIFDGGGLFNIDTSFGFGSNAYVGYVKLQKPFIQTITGTNNPFLLRGSNGSTKTVLPGDTMVVNLAPLQPYLNYDNPVTKISLVRRNGNNNTYIVDKQVVNGNSWTYTFTQDDVNCFLTAEVEVDAYTDVLLSRQYYVHKRENWVFPTKPTLSFITGNVTATNVSSSQEYIILPQEQFNQFLNNPDDANWWKNALVPTGSSLSMAGTMGKVNYVVTRFKETDIYLAGYRHEHAQILLDNTNMTKGLSLDVTAMGSNNFADKEYLNGYVTYTTRKNGVLKLTINPLPGNATDYAGIRGQDFSIAYSVSNGSDLCQLYANAACTTPLRENVRYKTVYLKPIVSGGNLLALNVGLFPDNGGPDDCIATSSLYLNVSEDDGTILPYTLLINNGDTLINHSNRVEGIPFTVFPARASLSGDVTVTYYTVQGPFPTIASQAARRPSFTVDKENRTITLIPNTSDMLINHTYSFTVAHKVNGQTYGYGYLLVRVTEKPIYSLDIEPKEAVMDLGSKLDLNITSDLDEAWREYNTNGRTTCTSSNEDVATVAYDNNKRTYVVTMTNNPEQIGEQATITLNVNGVEASCVVTAFGEKYNLTVDGVQVHTGNRDDVLGDGKVSYSGGSTGGTLSLNGATIGSGGILSRIYTLNIALNRENNINGKVELRGWSNSIEGNGKMIVTSNAGLEASNLNVSDGAKVEVNGTTKGVSVSFDLSVQGNESYIMGLASNYASFYVGDNIFGIIAQPATAYHNTATGYVEFPSGNAVAHETVKITGLPTGIRGDLNGDGNVNTGDISELYRALMNGINDPKYDLNGDGNVNAGDVSELYLIILGN